MRPADRHGIVWEFLTLDRLMTGQLIHLIYWGGLGVVTLGGFSVVGGAVGLALREGSAIGWLLAIPFLVAGLLVVTVLGLLWRAACEFYIAIFRISDDLRALRERGEFDPKP